MFASISDHEKGTKKGCRNGSILVSPERLFLHPFRVCLQAFIVGCILFALGLSFGSLLAPWTLFWFPFGSLWVTFWISTGRFGDLLGVMLKGRISKFGC